MVDSTSPEALSASPSSSNERIVFQTRPLRRLFPSPSPSPYRSNTRWSYHSPSTSPYRSSYSPSTSSDRPLVFQRTQRILHSPSLSLESLSNDEASSSRRKRQRLEEEEEEEEEEEGDSGNRNRDGVEVITTELPQNLLECPVCFHTLTIPTFQCDNGHIACSSCCTKLRKICPTCKFPTGRIRCRFAESVVEASIFPCPNAKHGCAEKFSYGKELAHKKICRFVMCYCPASNCSYTGVYKDLYRHYEESHHDMLDYFDFGTSHSFSLYSGIDNKVFQQSADGPLVVVQCFMVEQGLHVTVNCISPCAPEVDKLSYHFSYSSGHHNIEFGPVEMDRIQKVSLVNPEKGSCLFVPGYFLHEKYLDVEMHIRISRLNGEGGVESEEDAEGVDGAEEHKKE